MFYSNQQAFLLENIPCNNVSCKSVRRMFKVFWELSDLNQIKDAVVATFFDIYEDVSSTLYYSKQHLFLRCCICLCAIGRLLCRNVGFTARGRQCLQPGKFTPGMLPERWADSSSPSLPKSLLTLNMLHLSCPLWWQERSHRPYALSWLAVGGSLCPKLP